MTPGMSSPEPFDLASDVVRSLVLYALAEAQSGHATAIRVAVDGASFSVSDNGRGHAIDRTVDGAPYLRFVYTHLDYPFGAGGAQAVQLHGIGLSLINGMCSALTVVARKKDALLRMSFANGRLIDSERWNGPSGETGNTIAGTLDDRLHAGGADAAALRHWLLRVGAEHPGLMIEFNGAGLRRGGE